MKGISAGEMLSYLKDWRVWVAVAIIIIVIVWVMVTIERLSKTKTSTETETTETETAETKTDIEEDNDPPELVPVFTRVESVDIDVDTATDMDENDALALVEEQCESERIPGQSKGEYACLLAMEKIFRTKARVQVRDIEQLRNPITHQILELDIYIPEHKVACEYHGRQHYEYVPFFHRQGPKCLEYQQWKDTFKVDQCDKMGVFLVTVPYSVPVDKIETFIRNVLAKGGVIPYEIEY